MNAAALVWSNAPVIIGAHDTGPLIRSKDGFWLAIPTAAAGKSRRGGRTTPGDWERRTGLRLRFIYRRRGPSLLVAEGRLNSKGRALGSRAKTGRGLTTVLIFLLMPQVKLQKRLDLARDAERAVDGVPGRIVAKWGQVKSGDGRKAVVGFNFPVPFTRARQPWPGKLKAWPSNLRARRLASIFFRFAPVVAIWHEAERFAYLR